MGDRLADGVVGLALPLLSLLRLRLAGWVVDWDVEEEEVLGEEVLGEGVLEEAAVLEVVVKVTVLVLLVLGIADGIVKSWFYFPFLS
jgi:hypothetical protein